MPVIRRPKVSVSPSKFRNGMELRGGARAKVAAVIHGLQEDEPPAAAAATTTTATGKGSSKGAGRASDKKKKPSSTTKGGSKRPNTKSKAEDAAAKIASIAHVAAIEDALAKGVKEAASAPPRRPAKANKELERDSGPEELPVLPQEDPANRTLEYDDAEELLVKKMGSRENPAIPTRQQNMIESKVLQALAKSSSKPKPKPTYGKKAKQATNNTANAQVEADSSSEEFSSIQIVKAPQKSMEGLTSLDINQLEHEFNDDTSQADDEGEEGGEYEEDEEDEEGKEDDDYDEDTEAPAVAAVTSDESSEAEEAPSVPAPAEGSKPTKKHPVQPLREKVQANPLIVGGHNQNTCARHKTNNKDKTDADVTFKTPDTKKNINKLVKAWSKDVTHLPVLALPHGKKSKATTSGRPRTNTIPTRVKSISTTRTCVGTVATKLSLKRKRGEIESDDDEDDEPDVPTTVYGGLQDEDDTLEEQAALASPLKAQEAAQKSQANIVIEPGITAQTGFLKRLGNKDLPDGATNGGKWTVTFRQTFLTYLGASNEHIWGLEAEATVSVLQAIWNEVYKGNKKAGEPAIPFVVQKGDAVYQTATQRAREWRNTIASAAVSSVHDFFDHEELFSTEVRQQEATELLADLKFAFLQTKTVIENGVPTVKKNGRYLNPLIIHTLAQHLIEIQAAISVPGLIDKTDYPKAALTLSATAVHRVLWLWSNGFITYESCVSASAKGSKNGGGILKLTGKDGRVTKKTNFLKDQWEEEGDAHILDVWACTDGRLAQIRDAAEKVRKEVLLQKAGGKRTVALSAGSKQSRRSSYTAHVVSDSDYWYVM